jgi:hypothetical protein
MSLWGTEEARGYGSVYSSFLNRVDYSSSTVLPKHLPHSSLRVLLHCDACFMACAVLLQVAVADRTALILDIFSQRARTREGKLQVGQLLIV